SARFLSRRFHYYGFRVWAYCASAAEIALFGLVCFLIQYHTTAQCDLLWLRTMAFCILCKSRVPISVRHPTSPTPRLSFYGSCQGRRRSAERSLVRPATSSIRHS